MIEKKFCILSVAPIVASKLPDKFLSYVSDTDFPAGSLVQVPLRNKRVFGIVFSSQPAHDLKLHLKKERFNLKPIGPIYPERSRGVCSAEFLSFLKAAADYFITHPGAILRSIVPMLEAKPQTKWVDVQSIAEKRLKEYAEKISRGELYHFKQLRYPYINIKTLLMLANKELGIGPTCPVAKLCGVDPISSIIEIRGISEKMWEAWPPTKSLIFINRRGLVPILVCQDCGKTQNCSRCSAPLVLHSNMFLCHHCIFSKEIIDTCSHCGSWRLKQLGVGTQKIERELFYEPNRSYKIYRLDSDAAKTKKQAREIYNNFLKSNGIIVATELIFSVATKPFPYTFLLFPENILNLPEFSSAERLLRLLQRLSAITEKKLIIQTRTPQHPLLRSIAQNNLSRYVAKDLRLRKMLGYPPFKKLIKITLSHRDEKKLISEKDSLEKKIQHRELDFSSYAAFIKRVKSLYRWHILLRLDPEKTYPELYEFLYSLPPSIKVEVDPTSLL